MLALLDARGWPALIFLKAISRRVTSGLTYGVAAGFENSRGISWEAHSRGLCVYQSCATCGSLSRAGGGPYPDVVHSVQTLSNFLH